MGETGSDESGVGGPRGADADRADTSVAERSGHARRTTLITLATIAGVVLIADLITKIAAVAFIEPGRPVEIIGDVVTLRLVRNSGAAFSMASGYTWVLSLVALGVVVAILRYSGRLRSMPWIVGLALVLGGALGNLIDRFFRSPGPLRGHVVDFVSVGWWPVFNVADSAVVCGAILLVGLSLLGYEYDGTRSGFAARAGRRRPDRDGEPSVAPDGARTDKARTDDARTDTRTGEADD